jgi:uncharacterized membrane protein YgaE (UPF0421/DUF939 family)
MTIPRLTSFWTLGIVVQVIRPVAVNLAGEDVCGNCMAARNR